MVDAVERPESFGLYEPTRQLHVPQGHMALRHVGHHGYYLTNAMQPHHGALIHEGPFPAKDDEEAIRAFFEKADIHPGAFGFLDLQGFELAKYVRFFGQYFVIFPSAVQHIRAPGFLGLFREHTISAGFVAFEGRQGVRAFGKSEGLRLRSRGGEDTMFLSEILGWAS